MMVNSVQLVLIVLGVMTIRLGKEIPGSNDWRQPGFWGDIVLIAFGTSLIFIAAGMSSHA